MNLENTNETDKMDNDKVKMFTKIVNTKNAFFRSQQKNEPDLTDEEKFEIVKKLYDEKPTVFLSRYGEFLTKNDAQWFKTVNKPSNSAWAEEIEFFVDKLEKTDEKTLKNKIKNRRYAYLKRVLEKSDYFSDYEMRSRQPLLYDKMIGKFQTEMEMRTAFHSSGSDQSNSWSSVLLHLYDTKIVVFPKMLT